jgi:Zn-dependent protease with chaperone function
VIASLGRRLQPVLGRDRVWGPRLLAAVLAMVAAAEGLRLIIAGGSPETQAGGWYLIVIAAGLGVGALAGDHAMAPLPAAVDPEGELAQPETLGSPTADAPDTRPPVAARRRGAVILFVAAFAYAFLLPWLGFAVTNLLFTFAYLRWVSGHTWLRSALYAVIADIVFVAAFALLSVRMPDGVLGLPF